MKLMPNKCIDNLQQAWDRYRELHGETGSLFSEWVQLLRILLVVPATSATAERNLSMLRRIKTYLRATITQARLNQLCIINVFKEKVDALDCTDLCRKFVLTNEYRVNVFGKY